MAKKTKARPVIPRFTSEREAADWFASHSAEEFWHELLPARPIKLPREQVEAMRQRHRRRKTAISLRLDPDQIEKAQKIASRKSIGYQTQLRLWIAEGIQRESRRRG